MCSVMVLYQDTTLNTGDNMSTPIIYALIALMFGGLMMFFWQLGISRGANVTSFMIADGVAFTLFGIVVLFIQKQPWSLSPRLMGLGLIAGSAAAISWYSAMYALKLGAEGSLVFPISSLGVLVAVVLAFLVFREPVTFTKLVGLGLGVSSIIVLSR